MSVRNIARVLVNHKQPSKPKNILKVGKSWKGGVGENFLQKVVPHKKIGIAWLNVAKQLINNQASPKNILKVGKSWKGGVGENFLQKVVPHKKDY